MNLHSSKVGRWKAISGRGMTGLLDARVGQIAVCARVLSDLTASTPRNPDEARDFVSRPALGACSTLNCSAGFVPVDGLLAEVRLVSHVASECRVMTEDCVFNDGPARAHGVEEVPQMRLHI